MLVEFFKNCYFAYKLHICIFVVILVVIDNLICYFAFCPANFLQYSTYRPLIGLLSLTELDYCVSIWYLIQANICPLALLMGMGKTTHVVQKRKYIENVAVSYTSQHSSNIQPQSSPWKAFIMGPRFQVSKCTVCSLCKHNSHSSILLIIQILWWSHRLFSYSAFLICN